MENKKLRIEFNEWINALKNEINRLLEISFENTNERLINGEQNVPLTVEQIQLNQDLIEINNIEIKNGFPNEINMEDTTRLNDLRRKYSKR